MGKVRTGPLARRPDNSAFKQQRLPAWSPMLTAHTVLPFFYLMASICLLLGVWLLLTVQTIKEVKMDYTEAGTCNKCFEKRKNVSNAAQDCSCILVFPVEKAFKGNVFFYYGLKNFHQNLRRYMDSRDDGQMVGRKKSFKNPSSYCQPFMRDKDGLPIAPCGAVANSIFNDSFTFTYHPSGSPPVQVPLLRRGITWYTDKNIKYRNPTDGNLTLAQVFEGTAQPPYWQKPVYELDPYDPTNNGFINDDLIVWMREAAFPNFKKLYGFLNRANEPFTDGLPAGNYSITISYSILPLLSQVLWECWCLYRKVNHLRVPLCVFVSTASIFFHRLFSALTSALPDFPVQYFKGRKVVVLTTLTWFGGQNHFLPIAYLVTSSLVLLIAVTLTAVWWKFGKNGKNMEE